MARAEQIIQRPDGSEVKIVAHEFFGTGLHRSVGVHVFKRVNPNSNWTLCSDHPHPNWRDMSVEEYVKHGRSEMLQATTFAERVKVVRMLPPGDPA